MLISVLPLVLPLSLPLRWVSNTVSTSLSPSLSPVCLSHSLSCSPFRFDSLCSSLCLPLSLSLSPTLSRSLSVCRSLCPSLPLCLSLCLSPSLMWERLSLASTFYRAYPPVSICWKTPAPEVSPLHTSLRVEITPSLTASPRRRATIRRIKRIRHHRSVIYIMLALGVERLQEVFITEVQQQVHLMTL